jgi:transcriptional regulator with XRE-family HTH domain
VRRERRLSISNTSGSAIAMARIAAGLSQAALAERSGLSAATVSGAEMGRTRPQMATAAAIAKALGRTVRNFWPLLADAVEAGRLLDTVIPITRAVKPIERKRFNIKRVAYRDPEGGTKVVHFHRPPICCQELWVRRVDLNDPDSYRVLVGPVEIPAGGANA